MIAELLAELLVGLIELLAEVLLQMLFALAAEMLSELIVRLKQRNATLTAIVLACSGATAGLVSFLIFPHRLITARVGVPGISLLVAPIVSGVLMKLVGERLRRHGRRVSGIATLRGGVIFAFCLALIRWWLIGPTH